MITADIYLAPSCQAHPKPFSWINSVILTRALGGSCCSYPSVSLRGIQSLNQVLQVHSQEVAAQGLEPRSPGWFHCLCLQSPSSWILFLKQRFTFLRLQLLLEEGLTSPAAKTLFLTSPIICKEKHSTIFLGKISNLHKSREKSNEGPCPHHPTLTLTSIW